MTTNTEVQQGGECPNCKGVGQRWEPSGEKLPCDLCDVELPQDGWVWVPVRPTEEMLEAADDDHGQDDWRSDPDASPLTAAELAASIYTAMLSARPKPAIQQGGELPQDERAAILNLPFTRDAQGNALLKRADVERLLIAQRAASVPAQAVQLVAVSADRFTFEAAARKGLGPMIAGIDFQRSDDDEYKWAATRRLYEFWLAARAAPVPAASVPDAVEKVVQSIDSVSAIFAAAAPQTTEKK